MLRNVAHAVSHTAKFCKNIPPSKSLKSSIKSSHSLWIFCPSCYIEKRDRSQRETERDFYTAEIRNLPTKSPVPMRLLPSSESSLFHGRLAALPPPLPKFTEGIRMSPCSSLMSMMTPSSASYGPRQSIITSSPHIYKANNEHSEVARHITS